MFHRMVPPHNLLSLALLVAGTLAQSLLTWARIR